MCVGVDPAKLVFLDESGVDTAMTPTHARAPQGQRALGRAPGGHWKRLTILGALAADGLVAVMTVAAATTTQVFLAFVERVLLPTSPRWPRMPGRRRLVAMDTLHRTKLGPCALHSRRPASPATLQPRPQPD